MTYIHPADDLPLFSRTPLREWLESRRAIAVAAARHVPEARLLGTPLDDLAEEIAVEHRVTPLDVAEVPTVDYPERTVDARWLANSDVRDGSRPVPVPATGIVVHLAFTGDPTLLDLQPMPWGSPPPRARVSDGEIVVNAFWAGSINPEDAGVLRRIRAWIDARVLETRHAVEAHRAEVAAHDDRLLAAVHDTLEARRQAALGRRGLQAALGYPLKTRPDAPLTIAPDGIRRKQIVPEGVSGGAPGLPAVPGFVPEYALSPRQYGEVLAVLRAMGRSMEQTPRAFESLGEEDLRSILLAALNAVFEGAATAETFSFLGKTDLLIRHQGSSVFVGECKVWSGPKSLTDALDQILDYVTWRDTKTAVVMFVPRAEMGETLAALAAAADAHPHAKRRVGGVDGDWQWTFRHKTDSSRELTVAVLAFHLPRVESRTGKRRGRRDGQAAQS